MVKVLILGGTGMLGHTLVAHLSTQPHMDVCATVRSTTEVMNWLPTEYAAKFRSRVDVDNFDTVIRAVASFQPDIVINCIGLIKQLQIANDPFQAITINAQLPHRLSMLCQAARARLIHISTDCVFDGKKGNYNERDPSNATDLYGRTKFLGEVTYPHCVTLRTSIIGHELKGFHGLIEWFLGQEGVVRGFTKAIYSGLPTIELAKVISEFVIPNEDLKGVYHVSSDPISKFELLGLVAARYDKKIAIEPDSKVSIDRSMDSAGFRKISGYSPPPWPELIDKMFQNFIAAPFYKNRTS